ncbi:MAG: hypothetical protein KF724_06035 [Phycisphaeraceae bacterium]|nr:hypothetical protein [Phycisphaeraceae bacterium]
MSCRCQTWRVAIIASLSLAAAGCSTPGSEALQAYSAGNFQSAKQQILALDPAPRDEFLILCEQGKIALDAGDPEAAARSLARASDWAERFAIYEPKTTIAEEAGSIAINQTMRTWRGTYSDRIMVDAYSVLAQFWLGNIEQAAVYANRVAERQQDAEVEQRRQIAKVEREINSWRGGAAASLVQQVQQSPKFKASRESVEALAGAAYLNPFASWIAAMAWSATGDSTQVERARVMLRRTSDMVPDNSVVAAQAAMNPFETARHRPQVLVLLDACQGMSLQPLIIPLVTPWTGFSSIPLPIPQTHACGISGAQISGGGVTVTTEALSNNDAIFQAQFDRMLPEIIFRTAVMIAVKEGATVAAAQATRRNSGAQIGVLAAMSLYKAITNQPDLRSWRSLGKFTQIAQLDRPDNDTISLSILGAGGLAGAPASIVLPPGRVVMVYVRSINPGATVVYMFSLDPSDTSGESWAVRTVRDLP